MKTKLSVLAFIFVLAMAAMACGGSDKPVVNTPSGEQGGAVEETIPEVAVGSARSNPAPVGSEIIADDMAFVILGVERSADATVAAGNMFNSTPTADQEYIIVNLQVTCKKSSDEECSITPDFSTEVIGDKGVSYSKEFVTGVPNEFQSSTFYGGATVSGNLPFLVGKGETGLLLIYDPIFGDKFYLALP